MDTPLVSQCRGSNIPLDSMNMMGALLAGIAYGTFSRAIQLQGDDPPTCRYRPHHLLRRAMDGLIRPRPESLLAHIYDVLVVVNGHRQHRATNKVDPPCVRHPTTGRQPKRFYQREH